MLNWLKTLLVTWRPWFVPKQEFDRISDAFETGDYQKVLRETERIIARCNRPSRVFPVPGARMFFNSSEEYNNYIGCHPSRSHVVWEFPVASEAHYQRALVYEHSGRYKSSRLEIEHSLNEFPTSAKYSVELGFILLEMKYLSQSLQWFRQAIQHDLTTSREYEAHARLGMGIVAMEQGEFASARDRFLDAKRLPDSSREVISYLQLLTEIENDPYQRAGFFVARANWDLAAAAFQEALDINPHDFESHLGIAYAYKELQQLDLAVRHIKQAFKYNPYSSEVNFALGWVYMIQEDYKPAEAELKKAIAKNRYDPSYSVGLAMLYLEQIRAGCQEAAPKFKLAINRVLKLDSSFAEPYIILADYYLLSQRFSKALRTVHKAIALAPNNQDAHVLATEIYMELGRKKRSLHHLEEAADFGKDTEQMRLLRSRLQDDPL